MAAPTAVGLAGSLARRAARSHVAFLPPSLRSGCGGKKETAYITIGDKYINGNPGQGKFGGRIAQQPALYGGPNQPSRTKGKQLITQPAKRGPNSGTFGKWPYKSDPYKEGVGFLASQPADRRKLGFGSHDAYRSAEFTSTIATKRYREALKNQLASMKKPVDELDAKRMALEAKLEETRAKRLAIQKGRNKKWHDSHYDHAAKGDFTMALPGPEGLYDMGRTHVTEYDPNNGVDKFYSKNRATGRPGIGRSKRYNQYHRPRSTQYGDGAPVDFKPEFTTASRRVFVVCVCRARIEQLFFSTRILMLRVCYFHDRSTRRRSSTTRRTCGRTKWSKERRLFYPR